MGILDPRSFETDTYAPDILRRGLFAHLTPSMTYGGGLFGPPGFGQWPTQTAPVEAAIPSISQPPEIPSPAQSQEQAAPLAPDVFGSLGGWLHNNSATLMGLGAGIAGGRTWGEGISKGLQNATSGRALDQQRTANEQTVAALMRSGVDAGMARAAVGNPAILRAVLWRLYGPQPRPPTVPGTMREVPSLRGTG